MLQWRIGRAEQQLLHQTQVCGYRGKPNNERMAGFLLMWLQNFPTDWSELAADLDKFISCLTGLESQRKKEISKAAMAAQVRLI